jgi:glycerol-3-phosphate dehydrogenase (NAD+)
LVGVALPSNLRATTSATDALTGAAYVFHAIPIQVSKKFLSQYTDLIAPTVPIVSMSKGIHCETLQFMNDIISEVFGEEQLSAYLSGPSFAKEIVLGMPTGFVLASTDVALAQRVGALISDDRRVRVWTTDDVVGVEVGGALKNVYAIAAGAVEGVGLGYNPTALVVTRGCSEIKKLAVKLGARPETLSGLSGIGML